MRILSTSLERLIYFVFISCLFRIYLVNSRFVCLRTAKSQSWHYAVDPWMVYDKPEWHQYYESDQTAYSLPLGSLK